MAYTPLAFEQDSVLRPRRLLPYLIALVLLAWILGSIARSGTGGGNLLSNSVWLVYVIELLPLVAIGLMIILTISLIIDWRLLSDAIGFRLAPKKPGKRKNRSVEIVVWTATWLVAVMILLLRCGGIICDANGSVQNAADAVKNSFVGSGPLPTLPSFLSPALTLASLVDNNYFVAAFFG